MNVFEQSRETHPAEADANYEMYLSGVAYEKLGDYEKAASLFAQILETMPEHFPSALHTGDILRRNGQNKQAVEAYKLAEKFILKHLPNSNNESMPFYIWLYSGMGRSYEILKDYSSTLVCYRKLKEFKPHWKNDQFPEGLQRRIASLEKKVPKNGFAGLSLEQLTRLLGKEIATLSATRSSSLITRVFKFQQYQPGSSPKVDKIYAAWWAECLFLACHILETDFRSKPLKKIPADVYIKAASLALATELKQFADNGILTKEGHYENLLGIRLKEYKRLYSEKKSQDSAYKKFSLYATQVAALDSLTALTFIRTATSAGAEIQRELEAILKKIAAKMESAS